MSVFVCLNICFLLSISNKLATISKTPWKIKEILDFFLIVV